MTTFNSYEYDSEQPYWDTNSHDSGRLLNSEQTDALSRKQWRDAMNVAATIDGPEGAEIRQMVEEFYSCELNGESHGHYRNQSPEEGISPMADKESDSHKGSTLPPMYREGEIVIPTTQSDCENMAHHAQYFVGDSAAWRDGFNPEAYARKQKRANKIRAHHDIADLTLDSKGRVRAVNKRNLSTKASRIADKLAALNAKAERRAAKK